MFATCNNCGVWAIATVQAIKERGRLSDIIREIGGLEETDRITSVLRNKLDAPIFTFCKPDRYAHSPWFTGSHILREEVLRHITENKGQIAPDHFYVPFTNDYESGRNGLDAQIQELTYVTSDAEFEETFGVTIQDLLVRTRTMKQGSR